MIVYGPPKAGKTSFLIDFLNNTERLLDRELDYVVWFYGQPTKVIEALERDFKIQTVKGLPSNISDYIRDDGSYGLFVFDDLMQETSSSSDLVEIATRKCNHANLSWILMMQNLFFKGQDRLTLVRSAHYLTLFKNPLDTSIAQTMASRLMLSNRKSFMDIYKKATEKPHSYLFIDGAQDTNDKLRYRSNLFDEHQTAFVVRSEQG
jgi:hypothetical protein